MAAPIISISSDLFEESVGSHASRVILFGVILAIIPVILEVPIILTNLIVTPEVGTVSVILSTGVLDLVDYSSSSDSDPSKDSLPLPAEHRPKRHESLAAHDAMVSRWRDRVASRPSSPSGSSSYDTLAPSFEFPLASVVAPPGIRRRSATLIRPGEAILFGRPYRTHLNGPRKLLTARKRVIPFPARRLAWRRVSHHSSDRHSFPDSSSSGLPSDSSSFHFSGCDSSVLTPRHSEAFRRWRSAPLSTPYPLTTSESSLGSSSERSLDSSSPSSGPSRKRYRSPTVLVPSPTHDSRSITPTLADLLPPRKRFRDSYLPEDSEEEHMEVGTVDTKVVTDIGISVRVVAHTEDGLDMGVKVIASDVREDEEEYEAEASTADTREIAVDPLAIGGSSDSSSGGIPDLEDTVYDIVHYMSKIPIDWITETKTTQKQLETGQLAANRKRAILSDRVLSLRLEYLKVRRERDDTRRRLRRLESFVERRLGFRP
ncbi:hypothetical protein Tco_1423663 [Tanacetum coccineum]